ncbi:membrane protein YdbS with pleckstrin-like domain [Natronobacillus azotifigens]
MDNPKILQLIRTIILVISLYFLLIQEEISFFIGGIIFFVIFEVFIRHKKKRYKN